MRIIIMIMMLSTANTRPYRRGSIIRVEGEQSPRRAEAKKDEEEVFRRFVVGY